MKRFSKSEVKGQGQNNNKCRDIHSGSVALSVICIVPIAIRLLFVSARVIIIIKCDACLPETELTSPVTTSSSSLSVVKMTTSGVDETDVSVCCQQTHVVFGDLLSSMHRKVMSRHILSDEFDIYKYVYFQKSKISENQQHKKLHKIGSWLSILL